MCIFKTFYKNTVSLICLVLQCISQVQKQLPAKVQAALSHDGENWL